MRIRAARRDELPAVYDLLDQAFAEAPRSLFVAQTEHDSTFRLRHARVAVTDGRIAGYVRIFARTMLIRGVPVAAGGIGSVATHPGARHDGIATALLQDAIEQMQRETMAVSFLFTGIPGFYERLGYRIVREPYFEADASEAAATPTNSLYSLRSIEDADVRRLVAIHRTATARTTGATLRSARTWRDAQHWLTEDDAGCFVAERNGVPVAYIRSRCREYGHQILEAECVPRHEGAIATLVAAVGRRALTHNERIVALAPDTHPLATAFRTLPSTTETADVRFPMLMRSLSSDPAIDDAISHDEIRLWNSDRI